MKYGEIRSTLFNLAQKYPYGFTSGQLFDESNKAQLGLEKKQVLDFLYKSRYVFYDKKKKIFLLNLSETKSANKVKTAVELKEISESILQKKIEEQIIKITEQAFNNAQNGLNFIDLDINQIEQKDKIFNRLNELGYTIEELSPQAVKMVW